MIRWSEPTLAPAPASDALIKASAGGNDLVTRWTHGDLDLEFEFLLARDSAVGVLLQGRYHMPLADTWRAPGSVSRAPGLWQRMGIVLRTPRFDGGGEKIGSSRLVRLDLNDVVLTLDAELSGASSNTARRFSGSIPPETGAEWIARNATPMWAALQDGVTTDCDPAVQPKFGRQEEVEIGYKAGRPGR